MTDPIAVTFLRDEQHGGAAGQLGQVASALAAFVSAATESLDIAIYDFRLADAAAANTVVSALREAAQRGVAVRIGYDAGKPSSADADTFAVLEADPAPPGTAQWVTEHFAGTAVQVRAIKAGSQLMHSKYVVRDAPPPASGATAPATAAVWTGSTNFTDDAWTRQENNVVTVSDATLATAYRTDFDELWAASAIARTGAHDTGIATVGGGELGWDFCPGDGAAVNTALAARVTAARQRLVVASMVLTSPQVLAALAAALDRNVPVSGIYDGGQMDPIVARWRKSANDADILADWTKVSAHLVAKGSTPYTPSGPHDFMHLKVLLSDQTVITGSYNFSANAERNAENQIHLTDPATVTAYQRYLDAVIAAYSPAAPVESRPGRSAAPRQPR